MATEIGVTSVVNTTTTPLASEATFSGTFEENDYPDVGVSCHTDNGGMLYFDFSPDGTNVNTFPPNGFCVGAGVHEFHTALKLGRFFRVRLVNNAGAQTFLRIYTYYGRFRPPNVPINGLISDDADSTLVRVPYDPVEIARGNVQSVSPFSKFGMSERITPTTSVVSTTGVYQTPTAAVALEVLSASADDTAAGSGAQKVVVVGLDATWSEVVQVVTLNGTTPVAIPTPLIRMYHASVRESGSYATLWQNSHAGAITIRAAGGGDTWGEIPVVNGVAVGQTLLAAYTVPSGSMLFLQELDLAASTDRTVSVQLFTRENADVTTPPYTGIMNIRRQYDNISGQRSIPFRGVQTIPPKTDLGLLAYTKAGTASVSASCSGYLIKV